MRFAIGQGSSDRAWWRDRGATIVDVEGSINELGMLFCCEDEKGGFAGLTEGRQLFYYYRYISLHNIHYQTK